MNPKCIQAVQAAAQAAGRAAPSSARLQEIENHLSSSMRELARRDPDRWRGLTADERLQEASAHAQADIRAQAARRLDNAERQVIKVAETENRVNSILAAHVPTRTAAVKRDLINTNAYISAIRRELDGALMDTIESARSGQGMNIGQRALQMIFATDNRGMTADLAREVYANADGHTGNELAKLGARAWLDTIEAGRTRFNAAGGDVGKLGYGWMPHPWDTTRIRKAGAEQFASDVLPHVDRRQYLREDGSLMSDVEVTGFLTNAHETLATEGLNKIEPGDFRGTGNRANRGSDHRQIHLRDGDAWLAVMNQYGGSNLYDAMRGHIGRLSRDIGMVERYGPDPAATARVQFDMAERADGKPGALTIRPETYYGMVSGNTATPVSERVANVGLVLRSMQVAGKLGAAVWSSLADLGTLALTAGYNRLPYFDLARNIGAQASKDTRDWMAAHGMISDSIANSLDRWSADNLAPHWSGKLANATLRLSLLNAWTQGLRQGFKLTLAAKLAEMAKQPWESLTAFDRTRLQRAGITADDWTGLNGVTADVFRGHEVMTPQAISVGGNDRAQLAARVFGFLHDESEYAVVEPDLAARAITTMGGTQAGTYSGEIARTVMQFKSFPIAMMTRHWGRFLEGDMGESGAPMLANRVAYGTALMVTTLGLGAVSEQARQVLAGKDPVDIEKKPAKFLLAALMRGGGFGIAGDMMLTDTTAARSTQEALGRMALGPTFGTLADVWELTKGNVDEYLQGKDTHAGAEALRLGQSLGPVANVWWIKPMVDHGFMHAIQENLSPGYLARMKQRAFKDWGSSYWWAPGEALPQRAPEMR